MKCKILSIFIITIANISFAQERDKINVAFQEINVSNSALAASYKSVLYQTTLNNIIKLNKFNVINRSPETWGVIEKELALQDFIDPTTAVNLGKLLGVRYLIEGNISQFSSDRKVETSKDNRIDYYFSCIINATLKVINLETGKYEESVSSDTTINSSDRENAIQQAIQATSIELTKKLSAVFLITAKIKKTSLPDIITLNKGELDGVKKYTSFAILEEDKLTLEKRKVGLLKIISTTDYEASGRLLTGDFKSISTEHMVVELTEKLSNVVTIEKKEKDKVYINAGKDLNIKTGDIFVAIKKNETLLGTRIIVEEKVIGKIYVKDVNDDFSKAKIMSGSKNLAPGVIVTEAKKSGHKYNYIRVRYKSSPFITLKPTLENGIVSVTNRLGSYAVDTKYLNNLSSINDVKIASLGIGGKNLARDLTTTLYIDFYSIGPLNTWTGNLEIDYDQYIIPDKVGYYLGGAIGYGGLKQNIPQGYIEIISDGNESDLRAESIFLSGNIGFNFFIGRFIISTGVSVDYLKFSKWKYDIKLDGSTKSETAPDKIIPYANIDLSGLYYNCAIAYKFKK